MSKIKKIIIAFAVFALVGLAVYQIPAVQARATWYSIRIGAYARGVIHPVQQVPTVAVTPFVASPAPSAAPTEAPIASVTPTSTDVPLPSSVSLTAPKYELQDINNCGPASLTMALRMQGWQGNQYDISKVIKPIPQDRNVNPDELAYWVRNYAGWLSVQYRVGGDVHLLKELLAAGFPMIVEEVFNYDTPFWPNDDLWGAHYLLLTGYDDATRSFISQDSFHGANQSLTYDALEKNWKPFNYLYMVVYPPADEGVLRGILGANWDEDESRRHALQISQADTAHDPNDAFAWFNTGSNLVYFEQYADAARAFDSARNAGLPQRMTRYQFSPFIAYFQANRIDDLITLTDYTLQLTPNSEEAWLWQGWAKYRQDDIPAAVADWRKALKEHPGYPDAIYALNFVGAQP